MWLSASDSAVYVHLVLRASSHMDMMHAFFGVLDGEEEAACGQSLVERRCEVLADLGKSQAVRRSDGEEAGS